MAQKILLADDSMTAQNMGKKILAEGGYDVVAVSNGAAAVKKIAEHHPELVILDVYMPGYNGLEVCERLRAALETAKLPVLLTVGKLEPFQPEEGNRVKADGLLIKPFEATDLLATVKKLLEKRAAEVCAEDEAKQDAAFSDASYEEWKSDTAPEEQTQKIEVPPEMAGAPAMSDVLDMPAQSLAAAAAATPAFSIEPAVRDFADASMPAFDVDFQLDEVAAEAAPAVAEPGPNVPDPLLDAIMPELDAVEMAPAAPPAAEVEFTPAPVEEVEFTAAPQAQDATAEPLPDLEPTTLQDAIPVEVVPDAALVTAPDELAQFATTFGLEDAEIPTEVATGEPEVELAEAAEPEPEFETPVMAEPDTSLDEALAAIVEPEPAIIAEATESVAAPEPLVEEPAAEPEPVIAEAALELPPIMEEPEALVAESEPLLAEPAIELAPVVIEEAMPAVIEETAVTLEPAPVVIEEAAPVEAAPVEEIALIEETAAVDEDFSLAEELQRAFADVPPEPAVEETPEAAPVAVPGAEAHVAEPASVDVDAAAIAAIVDRVIDRVKPELIAAIVRELKG